MRKSALVLAFALASVVAPFCCSQAVQAAAPAKRPMTFEDMMKMKRLGETAVSPDGKWLAYSRDHRGSGPKHENSGAVVAGDCLASDEPVQDCCGAAGRCGVQFAPDGQADSVFQRRGGLAAGLAGGF